MYSSIQWISSGKSKVLDFQFFKVVRYGQHTRRWFTKSLFSSNSETNASDLLILSLLIVDAWIMNRWMYRTPSPKDLGKKSELFFMKGSLYSIKKMHSKLQKNPCHRVSDITVSSFLIFGNLTQTVFSKFSSELPEKLEEMRPYVLSDCRQNCLLGIHKFIKS